jgi:regulator of CtrA degradation
MTRKLIASLHVEAMVLSDEARSYFDGFGLADRMLLAPRARVILSCEALKVTTRLMHSVAWLLSHRTPTVPAHLTQHCSTILSGSPLGKATPSDRNVIADLPEEAQRIIAASIDLYTRIARLEASLKAPPTNIANPAFYLQQRLERSLALSVQPAAMAQPTG